MIIFAILVGWVVLSVCAIALVRGARDIPPRRDPIPPILRVTTRSELDR